MEGMKYYKAAIDEKTQMDKLQKYEHLTNELARQVAMQQLFAEERIR